MFLVFNKQKIYTYLVSIIMELFAIFKINKYINYTVTIKQEQVLEN